MGHNFKLMLATVLSAALAAALCDAAISAPPVVPQTGAAPVESRPVRPTKAQRPSQFSVGGDMDLATGDAAVAPPPEAPAEPQTEQASDHQPLRLPPREGSPTTERAPIHRPVPSATTVGSGLAIVLGLFLIAAWLLRRHAPGTVARLPIEAVEVLGRMPASGRQQLQLIRCGNKLLLVCVSTTGMETLTEITEPAEVHHLLNLCRKDHPQSASQTFRSILTQLSGERETPEAGGARRPAPGRGSLPGRQDAPGREGAYV